MAADPSPRGKGGSEVLKWCVKSEIFLLSPLVPARLARIRREGRNGKARAWLSLPLQMLFDFYRGAANLGKPFFTCKINDLICREVLLSQVSGLSAPSY